MARRPVIASSLPEAQNVALEAHPAAPVVLRLPGPAWEVPPEAEVLVTFQSHWKTAPAEAPAGWPGNLRYMQVASAGVDTLPPWAYAVPTLARAPGIQGPLMAEFVIGAVFAHEKRFAAPRLQSREEWVPTLLGGVAGKVLGIAGMGSIGAEVARLAQAVGLWVQGLTRSSPVALPGVRAASSLSDLFATSDHVVLTMPLTDSNRGIVDAALLAQAKPGLHLINVARGALIDQTALIAALDRGQLSAATLDVTDPEPLPAGHPLYRHPKVRLSPHASGSSEDADARTSALLTGNLDLWLAGAPIPYTLGSKA